MSSDNDVVDHTKTERGMSKLGSLIKSSHLLKAVTPILVAISGVSSLYSEPATSKARPSVNSETSKKPKTQAALALAKRETRFIENRGQFDARVKYKLDVNGQAIWVTAKGLIFDAVRTEPRSSSGPIQVNDVLLANKLAPDTTLRRMVVSESFVDANPEPAIEAHQRLPGVFNYFAGNDPSRWRTDIPGYSEITYRDVWPGVDVSLKIDADHLEQEFLVQPGADPDQIRISYGGIDKLEVLSDGSVSINTEFGALRETPPRTYQMQNGRRRPIKSRFKQISSTSYGFDVAKYRREDSLLIDPSLLYSTYLGGSGADYISGIAVDASGSIYVGGYTYSPDFPTTASAFQTSCGSACPNQVGYVAKLNPTGSALIYSTYLSGANTPYVQVNGIAVNSAGEAYLTGIAPLGFPTTPNAYQTNCNGTPFVTKLNGQGTGLLYSSCIGSGTAFAITVDSAGMAYITGTSSSFPTTPTAVQTTARIYYPLDSVCGYANTGDAFVAVINPASSGQASLTYGTYFGGECTDNGLTIAVDSYGKIYVAGVTFSPDYPCTLGAIECVYKGQPLCCWFANGTASTAGTGFFVKIDPTVAGSTGVIYSSLLGGTTGPSGDRVTGLAVDSSGSAYLTGYTSSPDFPTTPGAYERTLRGSANFVAKLTAGGSAFVYSTFVNATPDGYDSSARSSAIVVDTVGDAYVVGTTISPLFPVTANAFQPTYGSGTAASQQGDAYFAELNPQGSAPLYSSFLGGSGSDFGVGVAIDSTGDVYVAGYTGQPGLLPSLDFPTTPFAYQAFYAGGISDVFISKFPLGAPGGLSITSITPVFGGSAGTVSPQITGTGFHAGANVRLACGGSSIPGTDAIVSGNGRLISTTLSLGGIQPGICDVSVINPDGTSAALPQAFSIQPGGAPNIQIYKEATTATLGDGVTYYVTATNTGSVDAPASLVSEFLDPEFVLNRVVPAGVSSVQAMAANGVAMWATRSLGAGQSTRFSYSATFTPATPVGATIVGGPVCWALDLGFEAQCLAEIPGCPDAVVACTQAAATCAGALKDQADIPECGDQIAECYHSLLDCPLSTEATYCLQGKEAACNRFTSKIFSAADPNDLAGPAGIGGQHWLAAGQMLSYVISFANQPTAGAPAQQVVVTQPLDLNLDLSTVELSGVTVPNGSGPGIQVAIPPSSLSPLAGVTEFATDVDLRPTQNLLVSIDAKLNLLTPTITWTLTSIDPSTGLPPTNGGVGFLPPGREASVSFSAKPKQAIATGTQIGDQASVVFDVNAPLSTSTWLNTIDNTPPVSKVSSLAPSQSCPSFKVVWFGTDIGSGLKAFTIYGSDNGGPFTPWLSNTTANSVTYTGAVGHTYSFYSIASDLTGNLEASKTNAEATTSVIAATSCGPPSLSGQMLNVMESGTTVTAILQLTNSGFTAAQSVNINELSLRTLSGSGTVTLISPALPDVVGALGVGATTAVPLTFNVPSTVTRFSVTEGGEIGDASGNGYSFSMAQTVIP